ncbi:hypothetical protein Calag_0847 [Caldisphaera lagunensis DSM 15908]|uniref:Uncharacterized protein n=1 Tax=Caldisphaera lagunensis (strain DSM 15908 / JCM 11604 / ANMR 0165 / IC-154) TaxID=1056495 RepID=L0A9M5_CALLD|nr:hypothetical protein [Caldisphaera lagunensis]AFZ70588.1 hypothetical protein Calag_0847 [Caldisphaera lagunensis DSM 15908]
MKLKSYSSAILLGFPIPESSNPYIAVPIKEVTLNININKCNSPLVYLENFPNELNEYIKNFWIKLNNGLDERLCANIKLENDFKDSTYSGLYSVTTSLLLYALGKYNNETLSEEEIIELSRITDNIQDPSWAAVLDSLRYSSITGNTVVYRNDEENSTLIKTIFPIKFDKVITLRQRLTKEMLGNDVYGAIIHLMGISVLEASINIRELNNFNKVFNKFRIITDSLSQIVWDLKTSDNCFYVPGLPNTAEKICIENF